MLTGGSSPDQVCNENNERMFGVTKDPLNPAFQWTVVEQSHGGVSLMAYRLTLAVDQASIELH